MGALTPKKEEEEKEEGKIQHEADPPLLPRANQAMAAYHLLAI